MLATELLKLPYHEMHAILEAENQKMLEKVEKKGIRRLATKLGATEEQLKSFSLDRKIEELEQQFLLLFGNRST